MAPIPLSRATLQDLPQAVGRPDYDLRACRPGIVHLGFGGFHRAHAARYTHDLMQVQSEALAWGITGCGLMKVDREPIHALARQDGLYTLVERSRTRDVATVVGSVCDVIYAAEDASELLDRMDQARIVSLTVTESGYGLNRATKRLDPALPAIAGDLSDPSRPHTPVGLLVEAFRRRMQAGGPAFSAVSCDNIQHNGAVLSRVVHDYADRLDPRLAAWIAREARFPNTMVDRITPAAQSGDRAYIAEAFGVDDRWPTICEDFRQWVIEDDFADGRPDWDRVGAQFVADVAPYEFMKLRLLNASHLAVAGLGFLMGYDYIHQAMGDQRLSRYMQALMDRETGPTLYAVAGVNLQTYKATLIARFANPKIEDKVERVNNDAALNYLLDPIRDRLATGGGVDLLALGLAAWMRRVRGEDERGAPIDVRHPLAANLRQCAQKGGGDPRPLFDLKSLFGDLGSNGRLVAVTERWLSALYELGACATLERALGELGK